MLCPTKGNTKQEIFGPSFPRENIPLRKESLQCERAKREFDSFLINTCNSYPGTSCAGARVNNKQLLLN